MCTHLRWTIVSICDYARTICIILQHVGRYSAKCTQGSVLDILHFPSILNTRIDKNVPSTLNTLGTQPILVTCKETIDQWDIVRPCLVPSGNRRARSFANDLRYKVKEEDKHEFEQSWKDTLIPVVAPHCSRAKLRFSEGIQKQTLETKNLPIQLPPRRLPSSISGKKDTCSPGADFAALFHKL